MTITQVVAGLDAHPDTTSTLARVEPDREAALAAYRRDRRIHALEQVMADLDADEASARATSRFVSAAEAVPWLDDLPALWTASDDPGRPPWKALFEKVEVLGVQSVTIHPTPGAGAHGSSDAGSVPLLPDAGRAFRTNGRGERI